MSSYGINNLAIGLNVIANAVGKDQTLQQPNHQNETSRTESTRQRIRLQAANSTRMLRLNRKRSLFSTGRNFNLFGKRDDLRGWRVRRAGVIQDADIRSGFPASAAISPQRRYSLPIIIVTNYLPGRNFHIAWDCRIFGCDWINLSSTTAVCRTKNRCISTRWCSAVRTW